MKLTLGLDAETHQPFTIPLTGAATKTLGIFGKKGSGKTWTAAVWVEQLLHNKVPVVILDPVGRWWDLGLSATGARIHEARCLRGVPILANDCYVTINPQKWFG